MALKDCTPAVSRQNVEAALAARRSLSGASPRPKRLYLAIKTLAPP